MRWANAQGVAIVPSGGRTGLSGGAVAANGELVLSLERMHRVLAFDAVDRTLTVQAGIPLQKVQETAREHGLQYPVDFASRGSCSIGGNIATNAGGIRVVRYGNTREWVAGIKLVTGSGELMELGRGLVKDSSGYDLRASGDRLGGHAGHHCRGHAQAHRPAAAQQCDAAGAAVVRGADAGVRGVPRAAAVAGVRIPDRPRVEARPGARRAGAVRGRAPVLRRRRVCGRDAAQEAAALAAFEHCLEQGLVADGVISQSHAQAAQLWRLREGITESVARYLPYKNDVSVRVSAMPAFLAETQALLTQAYPHFEVVWFGHIGDGNLHINVLKPDDLDGAEFVRQCERSPALLARVLARHGGSISGRTRHRPGQEALPGRHAERGRDRAHARH